MENGLIDAILSCYANGLNALSSLLGVSVEIIKLGVGVAIVFLALVLCRLFCGRCCCCSCACSAESSTVPSEGESSASKESNDAISPAKFNQQNIALAEAYLDMQEAAKARECLAKLHASALSDEELGKVQQLQKRLEN